VASPPASCTPNDTPAARLTCQRFPRPVITLLSATSNGGAGEQPTTSVWTPPTLALKLVGTGGYQEAEPRRSRSRCASEEQRRDDRVERKEARPFRGRKLQGESPPVTLRGGGGVRGKSLGQLAASRTLLSHQVMICKPHLCLRWGFGIWFSEPLLKLYRANTSSNQTCPSSWLPSPGGRVAGKGAEIET
jgi:hypothetical protein